MTGVHFYLWGGSAWMVLCLVRQLGVEVPRPLRACIGIIGGLMWGAAAAPLIPEWHFESSLTTILIGGAMFLALAEMVRAFPRCCR